ncbi:MAG: hypothetical protein GY816_23150 [Cytophagales bacterium]|nr:hypothetical protein [Cytophagales bacterium]
MLNPPSTDVTGTECAGGIEEAIEAVREQVNSSSVEFSNTEINVPLGLSQNGDSVEAPTPLSESPTVREIVQCMYGLPLFFSFYALLAQQSRFAEHHIAKYIAFACNIVICAK